MNVKQVSTATVLIALGVVIAPLLWFPVLDSKAFPGQHMINGLAGVLLGPVWAAFIGFFIGVIRMGLGVGTIFSMPGGIPGGIVVGIFHILLRRAGKRHLNIAAFAEPLGTVLIGGTLAVYAFAPIVNRELALIPVWIGWSLSSIPGAVLSFIILETLRRTGLTSRFFSLE